MQKIIFEDEKLYKRIFNKQKEALH
jgi:hypothetical protein